MAVKELIEKLKACDQDAHVCWNSHSIDLWFGETVDQSIAHSDTSFEEDPPNWWPETGNVKIVELS